MEPTVVNVASEEDLVESTLDFIAELLSGLEIASDIAVTGEDDRQVTIRIDAQDDAAFLIGRRGQTLQAIQYLTNVAYGTRMDRRVQLDVGDYRERNAKNIEVEVRRAAQHVLETGERYTFEPMPSSDRRAAHQIIANDYPGLETYSTGEDPDRRLVVEPKGAPRDGEAPSRWQTRGAGREAKNFDARRGTYKSRRPAR